MEHAPATIDEAAECVRGSKRLQIVGCSSKPALTRAIDGADRLQTGSLSGVTDYQPDEFLITALAGTPLCELDRTLEAEGQYLPFDPPRAERGATLGGTVAANLSGPGRLKYGGLRDFLMGVRLVDGLGRLATGGGRVVKNAAGYDLPKLVAGSCGRLALIVEVTLKVFPRPTHSLSLRRSCGSLVDAMELCTRLCRSSLDIAALEIQPSGEIDLLMSGPEQATHAAFQRLLESTDSQWQTSDDLDVWNCYRQWQDVLPGERLTRVPISPSQVLSFDASMAQLCVPRRYGAAGNVAWVRWPAEKPVRMLDETLSHHRLGGTILTGSAARCRLGVRPDQNLTARLERAFDPNQRFASVS